MPFSLPGPPVEKKTQQLWSSEFVYSDKMEGAGVYSYFVL